MVKYETLLTRGPQGEICVNGTYVTGTEPVFVERVVLEELNASGNPIGSFTFPVHQYIDPVVQSSLMLVSMMPSGSNVKKARATACYIEIDKAAKSPILTL
jgi:predicted lipase